jgi:serine/threonine protein kinase
LLIIDLTIKISDFGFARVLDINQTTGQTQSVTGPLKWMSVEAIERQEYSTKSDVWAFGITMIEIMTSAPPYPGEIPVNVAIKVSNGLRPQLPSNRPEKLCELLKRCWETKPEDRPSFDEIYETLNEIQL